jgi:hypothetical protein
MDKIEKKGIALFITLLIIASILSIVAVSFSYLEKAREDSSRVSAIIQANLLYKNTLTILKRIFPKGIVDRKKIELIYSLPIILKDKKGDFDLTLVCKPLLVAVPITWIGTKYETSKDEKLIKKYEFANRVLDKLLEENNIEDIELFKKLIGFKDSSSSKKTLTQKPQIYSKEQFESLVIDYFFQTEDKNILKIDWQKYFVFVDVTKKAKIDGEYITPELISLVFDIPLDSVREEWKGGSADEDSDDGSSASNLENFLLNSGVSEGFDKDIFSTKPLNAMRCEERFFFNDRFYSFKFDYSNERSVNFEFNGEI